MTDRHPDLVGRLGGEFVKLERGEQTDDSLRNLAGRFDERGMLGSGEIPRGIETATDLFEVPPASESREIGSRNSVFPCVFGPYDLALRSQPAELVGF
jgi:hypothetical protein